MTSEEKSAGPPPTAIAMDIATGNWKAQATRAFITSNIAGVMEELCADDKFASVNDIATAAHLHPNATYRLLRYLSTFDVCIESTEERKFFKLGSVGTVLTPNHPQSVAKRLIWETSMVPALAWDKLDKFLITNEKTVEEAMGVNDLWAYFSKNPPALGLFQEAMTGYSNEEAFFLSNQEFSPTFDISGYGTVCDLGCAEGTLSLLLAKRFPECHFILSDLPECVARINSSTLPSNFTTDGSDFLTTVPKADAYLLKHIIHDWDDEKAKIILRNIFEANPEATIFVIEFGPMPEANLPHLSKGFDLHMGVMLGALERSQEEYDMLYEKSGYNRVGLHLLAGGAYPLYAQEIKPIS